MFTVDSTSDRRITFKKKKVIPTKHPAYHEWNEEGIFTKTGIRTLDGKYFECSKNEQTRASKYGYRLGDAAMARQLALIEVQEPSRFHVVVSPTKDYITPAMIKQASLLMLQNNH